MAKQSVNDVLDDADEGSELDQVLNSNATIGNYHSATKAVLDQLNNAINTVANGTNVSAPASSFTGGRTADFNYATDGDPQAGKTFAGSLNPHVGNYVGQDGSTYEDQNRSGYAEGPTVKGHATFSQRIDARAPLSGAEVKSRNDTEQFFVGKNGTATANDARFAKTFPQSATAQRLNDISASLPTNNGVPKLNTAPTLPPAFNQVGNSGRDYGNGAVFSPYGTVSRNPIAGTAPQITASIFSPDPKTAERANNTAAALKLPLVPQRSLYADNTFPELPSARY